MKSIKIIAVVFVCLISAFYVWSEESEREYAEAQYIKAVEFIKQEKYHDASVALVNYYSYGKPKNPKNHNLYCYVIAKKDMNEHDYSGAGYIIERIVDSSAINEFYYEDLLTIKKTIKKEKNIKDEKYKAELQAQREKEKDKQKKEEEEHKKHLYIGDTEDKITELWGNPDSVNRHVSSYGTTKQYVYYRGNKMICIYTENGIITDFQD